MFETYNFLLTGDKKYVNQILVTMTSVYENMKGKKLAFHLFVGGMDNSDYAKLKSFENKKRCSVFIYPMEDQEHYFKDVCPENSYNSHVSKAGNYRLLMTELLPLNVSKCLYLDCDIIVDTDLSDLFKSLKKNQLAAVVSEIACMEYREDMLKHWYDWEEFSNFVKEPLKYPHFNDGFFLLNVDLARKVKMFDYILEFISKHDYIPYTDQDILNAAIGQKHLGEILYLPPHYDVFWNTDHYRKFTRAYYSPDVIKDSFEHPKVIHYCGSWKPWDCGAWHHYELWWKYADLSPVAAELNEGNKHLLANKIHEGIIYHRGWGVEKNSHQALSCLMYAVKEGVIEASSEAIDCCKEIGDYKSLGELIPFAECDAESGNGSCAVRIAQAYRDGQGTIKDLDKSIYWYKKAIDCKVFWCKPEFFDVIELKCKEIHEKMFKIASMGAADGNAMSMIHLGRCYRDGIGVDIDPIKSMEWFEKGIESGADWAKEEFQQIVSCSRRCPFWKK